MQNHPLVNITLADILNKHSDMYKLDYAINEEKPNLDIGFFYNDGSKQVYKFSRIFNDKFNDKVFFRESDGNGIDEVISMELSSIGIISMKYYSEEMVFDGMALIALNRLVIINQHKPMEYICNIDINNYSPIPGTKFISWS